MLTAPPELAQSTLVEALAAGWAVAVATIEYAPVGWGSHHWQVVDTAGGRWFVTVDDLVTKRYRRDEPLDAGFGRLRASLGTARALREQGLPFVLAPVPTGSGEVVARLGDRFAAALYPYVAGESFDWGAFPSDEHRDAVLAMVIAVHSGETGPAGVDDFTVPHRDELADALAGRPSTSDGPYAGPLAELVEAHAGLVRRQLDRYDRLVAVADPARMVLTHGEPHPGNTMRTEQGYLLIDWDTVLVSQPERDLWSLDAGPAYTAATGVVPDPAMLELFALRWDIADIAVDVARFRRPHSGSPDDAKAWRLLEAHVTGLA